MEEKSYQLIASYVKQKFFVSTIYRQASTIEPMWYFETMIWEWDAEKRERGQILEQEDSGIDEEMALKNHFHLINNLFNPLHGNNNQTK